MVSRQPTHAAHSPGRALGFCPDDTGAKGPCATLFCFRGPASPRSLPAPEELRVPAGASEAL